MQRTRTAGAARRCRVVPRAAWLLLVCGLMARGGADERRLVINDNCGTYPGGKVPRYHRLELTFDLPWLSGKFPADERGRFMDRDANPFNPDVVDVRAVFSTPGSVGTPGRDVEAFGFWWQDFDVDCGRRSFDAGYEGDVYTPKGKPCWKVRFTPREAGAYRWFVTVREAGRETARSEPRTFDAAESDRKGFIRTSPENGMYFEFDDGSPYVAVGANLPHMQSIRASEEFFKLARENGMNFGRIHPIVGDQELEWSPPSEWGKSWRGIFEHHQGLGRYNLASAWRRDRILDWAEQSGVYLSYAWENGTGELIKGDEYHMWAYHPYNKARGGMCSDNHEYFTSAAARNHAKRRIRYYVARWGYSPNIFLWDGPNELDLAVVQGMWHENDAKWPAVTAWQQEMLRYVKQIDHYGHLQAAYSGCYPSEYMILPQYEYLRSVCRLPESALIHRHIYHPDVLGKIACAFDTFVDALDVPCNDVDWYKDNKNLEKFGKPLWIGEWGRTEKGAQDTEDALHDAIWCATLNGGMISPWYFSYIKSRGWLPRFKALAAFMEGERLGRLNMRRVREISTGSVSLKAFGLANGTRALAWIRNTGAETSDCKAVVPDMADGEYEVAVWDAWTGVARESIKAESSGGRLTVPLPGFRRSVAFKAQRGGSAR